jgi:uncharacterized integral membrane protein
VSRLLNFLYGLLLVVVLAAGVLLYVRNREPVVVDLYLAAPQANLALVIAVTLLAGAVFGVLASLPVILRLKRENRMLARSQSARAGGGQPHALDGG